MDNTKVVKQTIPRIPQVLGKNSNKQNIKREVNNLIEGFNNFEVDHQQNTANDEKGSISFTDLFSSEFMQHYTQFESIEELLSSGGFEINSEEDYAAIPDEDIDAHVAKTTKFDSWKELLTHAIEARFSRSIQ